MATKINDKPQPDWKILYALNLIAIFAFLSNNKKPPKGIKSKQVYLRYLIGDLVLKYLKKYGKPYLTKREYENFRKAISKRERKE
jgi:hypothetical protein